jgi:Bacterial Ig-like domain (group 3)
VERDRRPSTRLSGFARRFLSLAVLCIASSWWLVAAPASADTAPSNTGALPGISGTAQEGDVLTASHGDWSGDAPIAFAYAWSDGQTGDSITLSAGDVGQTLTVTVTASNDFGQGTATSDSYGPVLPAPPAPGNTPPGINGTPQQGDTLTVSTGDWTGNPTSFSYVWESCDSSGNDCTAISGATSSSYTLQASDVGSTIVAQVTATNLGGHNSATSAAAGPVLPPAPTIGNQLPGIIGTPRQGHTLNVTNGNWNNSPTSFTYGWADCDSNGAKCTTITGATSNSYTLQASDVGSKIVATVTASNAGGQNSSSSAPTAAILPTAPVVATAPGISGIAQQGRPLTVSQGNWTSSDPQPLTFSYQWQACDSSGCTSIGTNSSSYTVGAADVTKYISVTVTASNSGGSTPVTTAGVGPVLLPAPANTARPTISKSGGTLSVSLGTWSNAPTGFTYAWESCNASGVSCTAIPGATSSSYALSAADIGSTIVCLVTATGEGGQGSASTASTTVVAASDIPPASQPTTTGLLATPSAPVTNQSVTLIATVTAGASSTALWGTVTFEKGGSAIGGCANLPAVPSGRSATVACSTSFAASTAQLSAVFVPASGSILQGSSSPGARLTIGPGTSSTTLTAASSVHVGSSITYTAAVAPAAQRGPVQPTGLVEFLDGSTPIGPCASQTLSGGAATCTVSYGATGTHQITARYSGDANFSGSSSAAGQVSAVPVPTTVLGTITATMQWAFYFTPRYTTVRNLVVNGAPGSKVVVTCRGHGCPFASRLASLTHGKRCGRKAKRSCLVPGTLDLSPSFAGSRLGVGARITVRIIRPGWIGKSYRFTVRARRGPRVQIGSLPVP